VLERPESRDPILLEERHRFHLLAMKATLTKIMELWQQNAPDEITALEIDDVIDHIGSITGRISNEEILGRIFSTFCVGK
ncbi:MAG TPA: tRNA uridine-5-carboxymethylaminomethyl(34) synthesis GTPase MnmE, partial [Leptospiraceae bacterium]|nr:tRNA uridine-5-carboxymethylaminomethyl(34) synthesis GTPase MnmE [Leptospiraceae bacterium]